LRELVTVQIEEVSAWIAQKVNLKQDVYFAVSLQDQGKNAAKGKTRSSEGAAAIAGVWADVDCQDASGAHKSSDLPTEDEALAFLHGLVTPPTAIVHTGHGFHPYWLLDTPWIFESESDRLEAAALVKGFQAQLRSQMTGRGWDLDATHDLARILRIPGTRNYKTDPALEVAVRHLDLNRRYTRSQLSAQSEVTAKKTATNQAKGRKEKKNVTATATCQGVVKRCPFITATKADAASLPEPLWWGMVSILAFAKDGAIFIHQLSEAYPGYSREETNEKIHHALTADGPMTCAKVAELTGSRYCTECPFWEKIRTPLQLGTKAWNSDKDALFLTNDLEEEVKAVELSLSKVSEVFHRGGRLVRVMEMRLAGNPGTGIAPLEIQPINASALKVLLSSGKRFLRETQQGIHPVYPPDPLVNGLLEFGIYPHLRHLRGVTQVPVLRADGSVLQQAGYDPFSELLFRPLASFPLVPENPSDRDIANACELLMEVVVDFPFAQAEGPAVFIACILAHIGRHAFIGPVPMILVDANVPGAGKTKLADAASLISTGTILPRSTQTRVEEEERKRITSMLMKGGRFYLIDNVGGRLGGPVLDALLTSEIWQDRILGRTQEVSLPNHLQVIATGNNLELQADTIRRCLRIQMLCPVEHPEARSDFRHPDLEGWIRDHQPELLVAALTLLRGYVSAGRPPQELITLGSYGGWSRLVQATVKWALGLDPGRARVPIGEGSDLNTDILHLLMSGWMEIAPMHEHLSCRQAIERIRPGRTGQTILDAIEMGFPGKKQTPIELGNLLRKFRKRVHEGAFFDHDTSKSAEGRRWQLVTAPPDSNEKGCELTALI
jgi:hypothetical protein